MRIFKRVLPILLSVTAALSLTVPAQASVITGATPLWITYLSGPCVGNYSSFVNTVSVNPDNYAGPWLSQGERDYDNYISYISVHNSYNTANVFRGCYSGSYQQRAYGGNAVHQHIFYDYVCVADGCQLYSIYHDSWANGQEFSTV